MSTRCQVQIKQTRELQGWDDLISLYHHWDGYPEHMLPIIYRAFKNASKIPADYKHLGSNPNAFKLGRAGHIASYLCAADMHQFEPESSTELHSDIEWLYIIEPKQKKDSIYYQWYVTVYEPGDTIENSCKIAEGFIELLVIHSTQIQHGSFQS